MRDQRAGAQDDLDLAERLPTLRWHGGGDNHGTEQAKLAIEDVF